MSRNRPTGPARCTARLSRSGTAGTDTQRGDTQVAGPSLRGGSPRLNGSARPGVPLSQCSRFTLSPRPRWRGTGFTPWRGAVGPPPAAPGPPSLRGSWSRWTHSLPLPYTSPPVSPAGLPPPTSWGGRANARPSSGAGRSLTALRRTQWAKPSGRLSPWTPRIAERNPQSMQESLISSSQRASFASPADGEERASSPPPPACRQ